jgi:hypothetical protein
LGFCNLSTFTEKDIHIHSQLLLPVSFYLIQLISTYAKGSTNTCNIVLIKNFLITLMQWTELNILRRRRMNRMKWLRCTKDYQMRAI